MAINNRRNSGSYADARFRVVSISVVENEEGGQSRFLNHDILALAELMREKGSDVVQELSRAGTIMMSLPAGYSVEDTTLALDTLLREHGGMLGTFHGQKIHDVKGTGTKSGRKLKFFVSSDEKEARKVEVASLMDRLLAQRG